MFRRGFWHRLAHLFRKNESYADVWWESEEKEDNPRQMCGLRCRDCDSVESIAELKPADPKDESMN